MTYVKLVLFYCVLALAVLVVISGLASLVHQTITIYESAVLYCLTLIVFYTGRPTQEEAKRK